MYLVYVVPIATYRSEILLQSILILGRAGGQNLELFVI